MLNKLNKKYIPYILFALSFVILLIRAKYSFCWSDESFYHSLSARFFKGDSIFYDEWFPTQLSSLLTLPLYSAYVFITGGTEGIILYFRILFVVLELISACVTYRIISKHHGCFAGSITALLIQWYAHLNIATLSYYTMSLHFFVLAMLILYDYYMDGINDDKSALISLIACGLIFALCVLCLPTMCIAYFLVVVAGFIVILFAKLFKNCRLITDFNNALDFVYVFSRTLIGIVIPAALFLIYMLTHVSVTNFISSLEYVLTDDEHELSKLYPLRKMYLSIDESYGRVSKIAYAFIAVCIVIFIVSQIIRYTGSEKLKNLFSKISVPVKIAVFIADIMLFILYFIKSFGHTGYIFTAVMLFSLPLFLLSQNKNYRLFILFYVSGLLYSLVYSYSSNGMLYLLSMGHFICTFAGIIFAADFAKELKECKAGSIISIAVALVSVIVVTQTCTLRITNIYRDDCLSNLTVKTEMGPAKGIYTSSEHYEMYNNVYDTINEYCMADVSGDYSNLLISKLLPYGYMISDMNVASPTVWRNPMDSERLRQYYEIHPDKYPDVILVLDEYYGSYETCGDVEADYTPNENAESGYIYDYIKKNSFEKIDVSCGVVYRRTK